MPSCSIEGCDRPVLNEMRGWCRLHYDRFLRHGDPSINLRRPVRTLDDLLARCEERPCPRPELSPCLVWTGYRHRNGHGEIRTRAKTWQAHRLAYVLAFGGFMDSLQVNHRCDVPACCNPAHLLLGTQRENVHDAMRRGRASPPPNRRFREAR